MLAPSEFRQTKNALAWMLALFVVTLWVAYHVPLYTDEFGIHMVHSRYFLDHGEAGYFAAQCHKVYEPLHFPLTFLPFRMTEALVYGDLTHPLVLRVLGIFKFMVWVVLGAMLVIKSLGWNERARAATAGAWFVALSTVGVLPLMMVINRPEQGALIAITIALFTTLTPPSIISSKPVVQAMLILFSFTYLLTEHAKGLYFLPLFVACLIITKLRTWQRWLSFSLLGGITWQAIGFYRGFYSCPDNAFARQAVSAHSLSATPTAIFQHPLAFLSQAGRDLLSLDYLDNVSFSSGYMSDWLPPLSVGLVQSSVNVLFVGIFLAMGAIAIYEAVRSVKQVRFASIDSDVNSRLISLTLLFGIGVTMATEVTKNSYQSAFVVPLWILLFFLSARFWMDGKKAKALRILFISALAVSAASQAALLSSTLPYINHSWSKGGAVSGQIFSVSAMSFEQPREKMRSFYRSCGLNPDARLKFVLVDDLTYTVFWKTFYPLHVNEFIGRWQQSFSSLRSYLLQQQSDGVAARCDFLKGVKAKELLDIAQKDGDLCCVTRQQLESR